MRISVTPEKFDKEFEPTGKMIKESEMTFVQTYTHKRFTGIFKQIGYENSPFGEMVLLENVEVI